MIEEMNNFDIESVSTATLKKMKIQIESNQVSDIQYILSISKTTAFVAEWLKGIFDLLTDTSNYESGRIFYEKEQNE
mgnify:CR=1 FL=1